MIGGKRVRGTTALLEIDAVWISGTKDKSQVSNSVSPGDHLFSVAELGFGSGNADASAELRAKVGCVCAWVCVGSWGVLFAGD